MIVRDIMKRAVDRFGDHVALTQHGRSLTFGEAWERGCRMANLLSASGVRPGDRVASLEDNTIPAADLLLACTIGNFVRVPLYVRNATASHIHMVGHTGATAYIVDADHAADRDEIVAACPDLKFVMTRGDDYEDVLAGSDPADPRPKISENDYHIIRHTAGTTGLSKGVAFTNRRWMSVARDWLYGWPPIEPGDTFLHQSPISHGSGYFFTPTWMAGGRNYLVRKLVPDEVLALVERERITHMLGIPTILGILLKHPDAGERDLSSLKAITVSGAPIADDTIRLAYQTFGDALYTSFGQTEINPITFMHVKEWLSEVPGSNPLRSCGRAQHFGQMKIIDPATHEELPIGQEGEIAAKADGQMEAFWGDPQATEERIVDGWVFTGDVGKIDANGYLYIMDRKNDMIVSGGFNIYPAELENVILSHPDVSEVAVFSIPHERWGEAPAAVCVVDEHSTLTGDEIVELVKDRLGSYKKPAEVIVRTEPLPKSAAGKLLKRQLREPYWAGHDRRVAGS
ncbi:class I adenylate-forming enzyme family protein [Dactylosporangium sucinum]|uniref:AMP-dependent synthetase n=1 Tax=Dactylosporangium sucinum TaxID=1424081 RepID=A0A917UD35_9ACTN|nr:AMP-binding protein [Dactylosporangium sucinum]GGM76087.1 AMP-dependent synthetase [Dactylosporangium sucinum]